MQFEFLDRYLLDGTGAKADIIATLLSQGPDLPAARAFYEGMRLLGARTPDLTLLALRLVLAGKTADDERVVRLRSLSEAARKGSGEARSAYYAELAEQPAVP